MTTAAVAWHISAVADMLGVTANRRVGLTRAVVMTDGAVGRGDTPDRRLHGSPATVVVANGGGATAIGRAGVIGQAGAVGETVEPYRAIKVAVVAGVIRMAAGASDGGDAEGAGGIHVRAMAARRSFTGIRVGAAVAEFAVLAVRRAPDRRLGDAGRVVAGGVVTGIGTVVPGSDIDGCFILRGISSVSQHAAVVGIIQGPGGVVIDMDQGSTGITAIIRVTDSAGLAAVEMFIVGRADGFAGADGDIAHAGRRIAPVMARLTVQRGIDTGPIDGRQCRLGDVIPEIPETVRGAGEMTGGSAIPFFGDGVFLIADRGGQFCQTVAGPMVPLLTNTAGSIETWVISIEIGAGVTDGTVGAILGRGMDCRLGMNRIGTTVAMRTRIRRVTMTLVAGGAGSGHETAFAAIMLMTTGCAVCTFMVAAGNRPVVMQGGTVTGGAEIVIVDSGATVRFVEGIGTGQRTEDDVAGIVTGCILGILPGSEIFDHRSITGAVRIMASKTGLGEGCVVGFFGVAGGLVTVGLNVDRCFCVTRTRGGMAIPTTETTDEEFAVADSINMPGTEGNKCYVTGRTVLVAGRHTSEGVGRRSTVASRLVQGLTQVINSRYRDGG